MMRAVIQTTYGPPEVLELQEIEKPTAGDNEVLIRLRAAAVNFGDLLARDFKSTSPRRFNMPFLFWFFAKLYFGWRTPRLEVLGNEFAGTVEAVGQKVTSFRVGDDVFGYRGQEMGAYADYLSMPEKGVLAAMPEGLGYDEAAAIPYGGLVAIGLLRKANIQPGQKVLINGASGGIGSAAVQIAKSCGAEVTAVCGTPRLGYVKALGADVAIDYTREDFTDRDERYDLILDVLAKSSFSGCKNSLTENGSYLLASFKTPQILQMIWTKIWGKRRVKCVLAPCGVEDLRAVRALIEEDALKAVVDRRFSLEETAEAHRYVESGQKKGAVVVVMDQNTANSDRGN